jgi:hypothetical protein
MSYPSKGLEEDDIESPVETFTDRYRMCETRARGPGYPCPEVVCGSDPIFYHPAPINRRAEMPEFQSYYNGSGTNVTQPNKWKYSRYCRSFSEKSTGRCRQMWSRGVQRTVSSVLINATTCDTRWKLYAVVSGRKNTVVGYVRWQQTQGNHQDTTRGPDQRNTSRIGRLRGVVRWKLRGVSRDREESPTAGCNRGWKTTDCEGMVHIHGSTNGVWRQHSSTSITFHLKKTVQVFSYGSKDDTVYMETMACVILSKEETMEVSSDRHRPQVSDF